MYGVCVWGGMCVCVCVGEDTSFGSFLVHYSVSTLLTTYWVPWLHFVFTVTLCEGVECVTCGVGV